MFEYWWVICKQQCRSKYFDVFSMNLSDWTNGPWNTWNISKNRQGVLWSPEGLLVARSNTLCGAPCKNCLCFLNNILLFCSLKNPASFETVNGHQIRVVIFQQLQVVFEDLVPNMLLQKIQSTLHEGCLLYLLLHSIRHSPTQIFQSEWGFSFVETSRESSKKNSDLSDSFIGEVTFSLPKERCDFCPIQRQQTIRGYFEVRDSGKGMEVWLWQMSSNLVLRLF